MLRFSFIEWVTGVPSIQSLLDLEQNNPKKFDKIKTAHNKVLLKQINKQLKKSLILYFHPYTTNYLFMIDWTGDRPLCMGHQEYSTSRVPMDVETGRGLSACQIIFHHPIFLNNYFKELFNLVGREDEYGIRIHGRRYENPRGRIISGPTTMGETNPFLYLDPPITLALDVAEVLQGHNRSSSSGAAVRRLQQAMLERQEHESRPGRYPLPPDYQHVELVKRAQAETGQGIFDGEALDEYTRHRFSNVRERVPDPVEEEEPNENVEDLLEKIDTLLEYEDEAELPGDDYIPKVAVRV